MLGVIKEEAAENPTNSPKSLLYPFLLPIKKSILTDKKSKKTTGKGKTRLFDIDEELDHFEQQIESHDFCSPSAKLFQQSDSLVWCVVFTAREATAARASSHRSSCW